MDMDDQLPDDELQKKSYSEYTMDPIDRESIKEIKNMLKSGVELETEFLTDSVNFVSNLINKYEKIRENESTYEKINANMNLYSKDLQMLLEQLEERLMG